MKRYKEISELGNGSFGIVTKCKDKETGELVAIKKMKQKFKSFAECLELKEVKSLRKIQHENVVTLKEVFRENEYLHLVFELCKDSLLNVINEQSPLSEDRIADILTQLITGISHIHNQGFFHRDIKPENVMFSGDILKIVDFGLAREIRSRPPYTNYAGTRWYRAPECLLRSDCYNSPVDMWSVGIIACELFIVKPPFQGNTETDQLLKIFSILGSPSESNWPDGVKSLQKLGMKLPSTSGTGLSSLLPNAPKEAVNLISGLLQLDPKRRLTAKQALAHPFLSRASTLSNRALPKAIPTPLFHNYSSSQFHALETENEEEDTFKESLEVIEEVDVGEFGPKSEFNTSRPIDYSQFDQKEDAIDKLFDSLA